MIVLSEIRDTHAWRAAHIGRITPSDSTALLARPDSKRHRALIERLVLDYEGVPQHKVVEVDPWLAEHELDLRAALACYRAQYPEQPLSTDAAFVTHDVHSWLGASPHALLDGGEGVLLLRPHKSLRAFHQTKNNKAQRAREQLLMFVTGAKSCTVCDFWDGGGLVADKLAVRCVPREPEWLTAHVFPRLVATWKRVTSALDARARTAC